MHGKDTFLGAPNRGYTVIVPDIQAQSCGGPSSAEFELFISHLKNIKPNVPANACAVTQKRSIQYTNMAAPSQLKLLVKLYVEVEVIRARGTPKTDYPWQRCNLSYRYPRLNMKPKMAGSDRGPVTDCKLEGPIIFGRTGAIRAFFQRVFKPRPEDDHFGAPSWRGID